MTDRTPPAGLQRIYETNCETPSDINEHLPALRHLAEQCDIVAEFGCRWGASTSALLAGQPLELWTYDIDAVCMAHTVSTFGPVRGRTRLRAVCGSTLEERLPAGGVDLLFIDSLHTFYQLAAELLRHGTHVHRYLAFHDTVTFGARGEDGSEPGLMTAIEAYQATHPWRMVHHYPNNNGLLILERQK